MTTIDGLRVAVVVGGATEVGLATSLRFARQAFTVVVIDERPEALLHAQAEIRRAGGAPIILRGPLHDLDTAGDVKATVSDLGHCDVLVNAQLLVDRAPLLDGDVAVWQRVLTANLIAPMLMAQSLHPLLVRAAAPCVVNVGSIDGTLGNPSLPAYSASKGGLLALTHVMAHDFGKTGIRVNYVARCGSAIVPPPTAPDDGAKRRADATPLGRLGGPDETAAVIEFLASPGASFMNGATVTVDGGRSVVTPGCP